MAELAHLGPDGIRFNDGLFDTDNRYFRQVTSGGFSRMVAGPTVKITLDSGATDLVAWGFSVGSFTRDPDSYGLPTNTVTEFTL